MATQTQLVTGVDFVTVPTRDYEAAAKFYGEVLGLPFGKRCGNMPASSRPAT
jgi:catechol 2,3-dioxygenase-like lactoylglutathione lyase family enzyme